METLAEWGDAGHTVATTELNYFEVAYGIETVAGRPRKHELSTAWGQLLATLEVIPLTRRATLLAVRRQAELQRKGRFAALADLLIASCAKVGGCDVVVTRDTGVFDRIGLLPSETH